jgi:hypothetical protein
MLRNDPLCSFRDSAKSGAAYPEVEMSGASRKITRAKAKKPPPIKLEIDYAKLGEMLMPRLTEAVNKNLPSMAAYEKAIAELNAANVELKKMNDKLLGEFSESLDEFDKRIKKLEGVTDEPEAAVPEAPTPSTNS